jgi:zinc D-Ala-D-Ala carboxypeptidase
MTQLSKDFTAAELQCRCGCGALPKPELIRRLQEFRDHWGKPLVITSAARCQNYNSKQGFTPGSRHVKGEAVDILCRDPVTRYGLMSLAFRLGFGGVAAASNFVHLDIRPLSRPAVWTY